MNIGSESCAEISASIPNSESSSSSSLTWTILPDSVRDGLFWHLLWNASFESDFSSLKTICLLEHSFSCLRKLFIVVDLWLHFKQINCCKPWWMELFLNFENFKTPVQSNFDAMCFLKDSSTENVLLHPLHLILVPDGICVLFPPVFTSICFLSSFFWICCPKHFFRWSESVT